MSSLPVEFCENPKELYDKCKELTRIGEIASAIVCLQKALKIEYSEKYARRLQQLEEYLEEFDDGSRMVAIGDFLICKSLVDKLYPYQRQGVQWLWGLYKQKKGGVLGDDMGLGKTIQIIAFLSGMFDEEKIKNVLIVMPMSLLGNWQREFEKWASGINVDLFHGVTGYERERMTRRVHRNGGVMLTTYGMLEKNWEILSSYNRSQLIWDYVILDEAHKIKNPTKTTKAAHAVPARNRIALTGTPLQNNLQEMWALFDFVHQGALLGTAKTFKAEFEHPISRSREKCCSHGEKLLGTKMAEALRKKISPFFLRRTKAEVLNGNNENKENILEPISSEAVNCIPSICPKNDFIIWIKLSDLQIKLYKEFLQSNEVQEVLMTTRSPLVQLNVLKKICDHPQLLPPKAIEILGLNDENIHGARQLTVDKLISESGKLAFLIKLLDNLQASGHRCLVFSQSKRILGFIEEILKTHRIRYLRMDGDTVAAERQTYVNKFQKSYTYSVFLLTSQVGGVGLNLTAADRVIIYDPNWNPGTDSQAVDRVHRIGQAKHVIVYRLVTCGTIEEKIYRRQIFKSSLTVQIVGDDSNPERYFTHQELRELFIMDDPLSSKTQIQLEEKHRGKRRSNIELDEHIEFLSSCGIFGISDHNLMFIEKAMDEVLDVPTTENIMHRVQKAEKQITMEAELQEQVILKTGTLARHISPVQKKKKETGMYTVPQQHQSNTKVLASAVVELDESFEKFINISSAAESPVSSPGRWGTPIMQDENSLNIPLPPSNLQCLQEAVANMSLVSVSSVENQYDDSSDRASSPNISESAKNSRSPSPLPKKNGSTIYISETDEEEDDNSVNDDVDARDSNRVCAAVQNLIPESSDEEATVGSSLRKPKNISCNETKAPREENLSPNNSESCFRDEHVHQDSDVEIAGGTSHEESIDSTDIFDIEDNYIRKYNKPTVREADKESSYSRRQSSVFASLLLESDDDVDMQATPAASGNESNDQYSDASLELDEDEPVVRSVRHLQRQLSYSSEDLSD